MLHVHPYVYLRGLHRRETGTFVVGLPGRYYIFILRITIHFVVYLSEDIKLECVQILPLLELLPAAGATDIKYKKFN